MGDFAVAALLIIIAVLLWCVICDVKIPNIKKSIRDMWVRRFYHTFKEEGMSDDDILDMIGTMPLWKIKRAVKTFKKSEKQQV